MKIKKPFFKRKEIQIVLICTVLAFLLGIIGNISYYYDSYYSKSTVWNHDLSEGLSIFFSSLFSTIRMFGMVLDAKLTNDEISRQTYYLLAFARWFAIIPTGFALLGVLKKLLPRVWARCSYILWGQRQTRIVLIGNNEENIQFYRLAESSGNVLILAENQGGTDSLQSDRIRYYAPESEFVDASGDDAMRETFIHQLKKALSDQRQKFTAVINTQTEEWNIHLCKAAVECIRKSVEDDKKELERLLKEQKKLTREKADLLIPEILSCKRRIVEKLDRIRLVVFGDRQHEAIYQELEDASFGVLKYTNRYHLTSFDFLTRYPLTSFLSEQNCNLLGDSACVAENAEFNVIFVGFGDTNQEIFRDSFATNQFLVHRKGDLPELKRVRYHIFDKEKDVHKKNLNHTIFRYTENFWPQFDVNGGSQLHQADYLPLAPLPADVFFHTGIDINNAGFYKEIRQICVENPNSVDCVLIAIGSDFDNIELAQLLSEKTQDWQINNLHIFARVRDEKNQEVGTYLNGSKNRHYIPFGNEQFTLEQALHHEIEKLAFDRKFKDPGEKSASSNLQEEEILADREIANKYAWYTMEQNKRRSSIYNLLALRLKMQLLRMDYVPKEAPGDGLKKEDYFLLYADGCEPEKSKDPSRYRGSIYDYEKPVNIDDFKKDLTRLNLVVQEHYRWNAYMITCGFIPPTVEEIKRGVVKDYKSRRIHANLCSFEGLFRYHELRQELLGTDQKPENVIKYDYKLMDEAWDFLDRCGYKIIRR